jgi:hypothetical protein
MGTIVVTEDASLDGVIEQVSDWVAPPGDADADDSDIVATLREHMDAQAALLLGRKTFETFRGYWPAQTDDTTGVAAYLNRSPKVRRVQYSRKTRVGEHDGPTRRIG